MRGGRRVLDFRNRPPLPAFAPPFRLKRHLRCNEASQDQFLFGTSYRFSSMAEPDYATLRLPLPDAVMDKYLWTNAARLLKLPADVHLPKRESAR